MKRLLSWLLVLVMVFGLLPMSAFAVEVETGNGNDDFELGMDELLPTEPEFGTAENPYVIPVGDRTNFVGIAVPAGGSVYAVADNTTGPYNVVMGTYDAAYNVVYNPRLPGAVWYAEADADGYYQINELMDQPFSYTLQVNNPSDTDLYIIAWLTAGDTTGTMGDPAQLVIGENEVTLKSGSQGYYYTWTAEKDGTLILNIDSNVAGWTYVVNNMTTYKYGDTQWSDSDPVVNPAEIEVAAGDELQIIVNTYDPADEFNAPAGTVTVNASFEEPVVEPEYVGSIRLRSAALNLLDKVAIIYKASDDAIATDNAYVAERGVLLYDSLENAQSKDVSLATSVIALEWSAADARYIGQSEGIDARDMADSMFAVGYLKMIDGTYIFGTKDGVDQVIEYSPLIYCKSKMNDAKVGKLSCALMHYGAAAQAAQYGMTEGFMNEGFPAFAYDESVLGENVFSVDTTVTNGIKLRSAALDLKGAISYIVKFTVEDSSLSDKKMYAEYNLMGESSSVELTLGDDGRLWATISGIAAKDMGETLHVRGYYLDDNGNKVYGAELVYSGYEYARRTLTSSSADLNTKNLAKAFAMYIYEAYQYAN